MLRDRRIAVERARQSAIARGADLSDDRGRVLRADPDEPRPYRPDLECAYSRAAFRELIERASRLIVVPDQAALGAATAPGGVYTPTAGAALPVSFEEEGWIVGFRADAKGLGTHAGRASLMAKIETQGQASAITTNGQGSAFIPLSLLFGVPAIGLGSSPLVRRVEPHDRLFVTWANGSMSTSFTPCGAFVFISCAELERMGWPRDRPPPAVGSDLPAYTRAMVLPNLPIAGGQATPNAPLTANGTSNGTITEIQHEGELLGFRGDCVTDDFVAQRPNLAFQIEMFKDRSAITTDGFALAFAQAPLLCAGNEQFFHFARRVHIRDKITTTARNTGASTLSASGVWFMRADVDVARRNLIEG